LIGTIVGAGIFGLPYVFAKAGYVVGIFYLLFFAVIFLISFLCYGETVLRTQDNMEMAGYTERYLGKWGKRIITLSLVLGTYAALIAYMIGVGKFLHALFGMGIGGTPETWSVVFWVVCSLAVFFGITTVGSLEFIMTLCLIAVTFVLFKWAWPHINFNYFSGVHWENVFLPYGPVLFALGGASAIPTMRRILGEKAKFLKPAIIFGLIIPALIYLFFTFSVVGISGPNTSEEAISGFYQFVDGKILLIGAVYGILTMTTSFLVLAYILRELLRRDYKIPLLLAWVLTTAVPLILFTAGFRSFINVISFSGGVLSGIQGIILISAYYQAKKKGDRTPEFSFNLPKPIAYFIFLIFIAGIIYQFIYR